MIKYYFVSYNYKQGLNVGIGRIGYKTDFGFMCLQQFENDAIKLLGFENVAVINFIEVSEEQYEILFRKYDRPAD